MCGIANIHTINRNNGGIRKKTSVKLAYDILSCIWIWVLRASLEDYQEGGQGAMLPSSNIHRFRYLTCCSREFMETSE